MKKTLIAATIAFGWGGLANASPGPDTPTLKAYVGGVRDASHERSLGLRHLSVSVAVRGAVAETTIEAIFINPTNETLEGDFRFRLPDSAVVTGYALDVNGHMIDGVLVDRPRARAVYSARVRARIDPGIAEVSSDNVFHTDIHPIFPGRGRTIRLRFVMPIAPSGYHLPIVAAAPVEGWRIALRASGVDAPPILTLPDGKHLQLVHSDQGFTGSTERTGVPLNGEIAFDLPTMPAVIVNDTSFGERDVQLGGALDAPVAASGGTLRVYWDRARSRLDGDVATEVALLRTVIDRMRPSSIALVAFNSSGADRMTVTNGEAAAAWLAKVQYRGATSYAPIQHDGPADRCLLFAPGGPTIDRRVAFAPPCRLDAVISAANADRGWLRHASTSTGGEAVAVSATTMDGIAKRLAGPPNGITGIVDQDGRRLPFVVLDAPAGRWLVIARAPVGGPVTVKLVSGGAAHDQVVALGEPTETFDATGALIAADQLSTLGASDQRSDYVALSRRYGIASPSLSFLVLETPNDYLAAKIDPPIGYLADARDDYLRARKAAEADSASKTAAWIDHVADEWAQTVAWWDKRFDPAAVPRKVATSTSFDRTSPTQVYTPAPIAAPGAPPPPAPPPPPPPPSPTVSPSVAANDIVVTATRASPNTGGAPGNAGEGVSERRNLYGASIQIDAWQPERSYLELYDGRPVDFDERFLEAQKRHGGLPIFYLDTAEWMRRHGHGDGAAEMVLSALELPTANEATLGIVADRLERYGELDRAIELRERQAVLDPDRPQPRRLLALALARRAALRPAAAKADLERAVALLYAVATTPHDEAWDGIETIALVEANALLPKLRRTGSTVAMDSRLIHLLDLDTRVVIDWTNDGSDMDLWVDEPDGERAIYNNPRTAIGGHLSHDMTRGYGPEEYMLRVAPPGPYLVQANVYAPDRLDPNGVTQLTAHLFHDYGRPGQREETVDVEVTRDDKGAKSIGKIVVLPKSGKK